MGNNLEKEEIKKGKKKTEKWKKSLDRSTHGRTLGDSRMGYRPPVHPPSQPVAVI
jgi:hypothetical protein